MWVLLLVCACLVQPTAVSGQLQPQSWRVLVMRVDFSFEFPDDLSTSGRGKFDLRTIGQAIPDTRLPFDGPPHDRMFYEHHLDALAHYYDVVSEGKVSIEAEVFPRVDSLAYTLPGSILDYGNGRTPEEIGQLWWQLISDAVALADADPDGPIFANYDSYLFIHAGLGFETGQLNDIRSVFLSPEDLADYGAPILADDGATAIDDAWILPEVVVANGRAGLNGILAKFFGHQLGLPGLSNFSAGLPALGGWSLMDVGANRVGFVLWNGVLEPIFGFVPPHPMAWSKARLGWVDPVVVERDTVIGILASDILSTDHPGTAKVVRVPLSPTEYLLLSNRQQRGRPEFVLPAGSLAFDIETSWVDTDEVVFARYIDVAEIDSLVGRGTGPLIRVVDDEYDLFVPSSGILAWHVDSTVFRNTPDFFNSERSRPAIMLHEADGERDIGNAFFDRQDRTEGNRGDAFFSGGGIDDVPGKTVLGVDTRPSTQTHTGLTSGVEIEILDQIAEVMRVSIRFTHSSPGWPVPLSDPSVLRMMGTAEASRSLLASDGEQTLAYNAQGEQIGDWQGRILAATDDHILVAHADEVQFRNTQSADDAPVWSVEAESNPHQALIAPILPGAALTVAVADEDRLRLIAVEDGSALASHSLRVTAMTAADLNGDSQLQLLIGTSDGLYEVGGTSADGTSAVRISSLSSLSIVSLVSGDLDNDGQDEVLAIGSAGDLWILDGAASARVGQLTGIQTGEPALGDIDGDGRLEIAIATTVGLYAFEVSSVTEALLIGAGFPMSAPVHHEVGPFTSGPVLADLNDDGSQEILLTASNGVYAVGASGLIISGFPIPTATEPVGSPMVIDIDGDGRTQVAVATGEGIHLFRPRITLDGTSGLAAWPQTGGAGSGLNRHTLALQVQTPAGKSLLAPGSAYCYPNPVSGTDGRAHIRFELTQDASIRLDIYDAIGTRIESIRAELSGGAEHELNWSIDSYASGLYLCRLQARGDGGASGEVTLRLAVSQ